MNIKWKNEKHLIRHSERRYGEQGIAKSRSDETLLTVDFNLRKRNDLQTTPSPAGTTLMHIVPTLRDLGAERGVHIRRLRFASPTVNKVLSHAGHFVVDMTVNLPEKIKNRTKCKIQYMI